ncbi:MAG: hypothetical protein HQK79_15045 [Desulfobacterales bacterium]|nr:hypothetical protein [Desulfobacterales bacterium]MBF0395723.1 hypothetical protein [Desulfobacterales bacterium]
MDKIKSLKDMFQTTIESIINSVEAIHKAIADTLFKNVEIIGIFKEEIEQLKENRDNYVSGVYEVIRSVHKKVCNLADYLIAQMEKTELIENHENLEVQN